jgi:hypothetical protein
MEEFISKTNTEDNVTELKNNVVPETNENRKSIRHRELLHSFINASAEVKVTEDCNDDGDITFEVSLRSLGLTYDTFIKYRTELCSDFIANFMGELLVRENLDKFTKILINLKDLYISKVTAYKHKKFGMKIFKDKFVFTFHISFIQSILTEDFRKKLD